MFTFALFISDSIFSINRRYMHMYIIYVLIRIFHVEFRFKYITCTSIVSKLLSYTKIQIDAPICNITMQRREFIVIFSRKHFQFRQRKFYPECLSIINIKRSSQNRIRKLNTILIVGVNSWYFVSINRLNMLSFFKR